MPTEHSADSDCPSDREEAESSQPRKTVSPDQSPLSSDEEKVCGLVVCEGGGGGEGRRGEGEVNNHTACLL